MTIVSPQLCTLCGLNLLTGRQTKYCSKTCEMRGAEALRQSRGGQAAYRKSIRATLTQKAREYRDRKAVDRLCRHCGTAFKARMTGTGHASYCSKTCKNRKVDLRKKRVYTKQVLTCVRCTSWFRSEYPDQKYCSPGCKFLPERKSWVMGWCAWCTSAFTSAQPDARYCSDRCGKKMNRARRDERLARAYVEDVSPAKVFGNDNWMCWLCGEEADPTRVAPYPLAATVDHLIPVSEGGEHSYANVRTAHFICNSRRGARRVAELEWATPVV